MSNIYVTRYFKQVNFGKYPLHGKSKSNRFTLYPRILISTECSSPAPYRKQDCFKHSVFLIFCLTQTVRYFQSYLCVIACVEGIFFPVEDTYQNFLFPGLYEFPIAVVSSRQVSPDCTKVVLIINRHSKGKLQCNLFEAPHYTTTQGQPFKKIGNVLFQSQRSQKYLSIESKLNLQRRLNLHSRQNSADFTQDNRKPLQSKIFIP